MAFIVKLVLPNNELTDNTGLSVSFLYLQWRETNDEMFLYCGN